MPNPGRLAAVEAGCQTQGLMPGWAAIRKTGISVWQELVYSPQDRHSPYRQAAVPILGLFLMSVVCFLAPAEAATLSPDLLTPRNH